MRANLLSNAVLLGTISLGCTFYTNCPESNRSTGSGGSGGSPNGPSGSGGDTSEGGQNPLGGKGGQDSLGGEGGLAPVGGEGGSDVISGEWVEATGDLAGVKTACGDLAYLSAKPGEDMLIVSLPYNGLWSSTDGGKTWSPLGTGKGSAMILNGAGIVLYDPEDPDVFWEAGTYGGNGVYKTTDKGETFIALGDITQNQMVSVDFTDPERKTLLASGHEQGQKLYRSTDGGTSWEEIGEAIPADAIYCDFPHVVDANNYLLGCTGYGDGKNGIFRSSDAGESWEYVSPHGGYLAPLQASDGTLYWVGLQGGGVVRSTDQGETWTGVSSSGVSTRPVELPDGRLAITGSDGVMISSDRAETWRRVTPSIPFRPSGLVYSPEQKAFFSWRSSCDEEVPADAIVRFDFDYEVK